MLTYLKTNILTSKAQTIVNTVNTVGVMGKGLASAMKARHPEMFEIYRRVCAEKKLEIGKLLLWRGKDQWILNFPTKKHWRNPSKLSYIEEGLEKFIREYEQRGIWEISFPRLGCGNGGLDWEDVQPLMERYLSNLPIRVYIHDLGVDIGQPEHAGGLAKPITFRRSYDQFLEDLRAVTLANRGSFETLTNFKPFQGSFDAEGNLKIERPSRKATIRKEELLDLYSMLLRGPVTNRKLSGRAFEEAHYLFAILGQLPYIRLIEIQKLGQSPTSAVEIKDEARDLHATSANSAQREIAWH